MARPEHVATEKNRDIVKALAGFGMPQEKIAQVIGITFKTLQKHYSTEIDEGKATVDAAVYSALFQSIKRGNVASIIFYLKTQKGWKETVRNELTGADGNPIEMQKYVDIPPHETREQWEARVAKEQAEKAL